MKIANGIRFCLFMRATIAIRAGKSHAVAGGIDPVSSSFLVIYVLANKKLVELIFCKIA